jgi:hypothetical protein
MILLKPESLGNTIGSAHLDADHSWLGMKPDPRPDNPLGERISVPRMVTAQFNSLSYEMILQPTRKQILEELWKMMSGKNPKHFFTVYLTVFMLLHEVSVASADRRRWASQNAAIFQEQVGLLSQNGESDAANQKQGPYSLPEFVEGLQEGANIVLSYWHYYRRGFHPLTTDWEDPNKDKMLWAELDDGHRKLLIETCQAYRTWGKASYNPD